MPRRYLAGTRTPRKSSELMVLVGVGCFAFYCWTMRSVTFGHQEGRAFLEPSPPKSMLHRRNSPEAIQHELLQAGTSQGEAPLFSGRALVTIAIAFTSFHITRALSRRSRIACRANVEEKTGMVNTVINSGPVELGLTKDQQDAFLEQRCSGLRKLMSENMEDFSDEVDELSWQWARHLLPFMDRQRHDLSSHKRRTILKQRSFFEKMRLFKPLAMKYPTLLRRMSIKDFPDRECRDLTINTEWIMNEEMIAGFSYEDFVAETTGNTFDKWEMPQIGEIIQGVVAGFAKDGAFIEVGAKTWAYVPVKNIALVPIFAPQEALSLGQEVSARVISLGGESKIDGDPQATQIVLSMTDLQEAAAWEEIDELTSGTREGGPIIEVMVREMRAYGAVVQTELGMEGLIPNNFLADRVGDTGLVGSTIDVELLDASTDRTKVKTTGAVRPSEFAVRFSFRNTAAKALAEKLEVEQVIDAKVINADAMNGLTVEVEGMQLQMKAADVTSATKFSVADMFEEGEEIKVYVLSVVKESGEIRLSTRALEPKRGMMVTNKKMCFAKAEQTAKKFTAGRRKEKQRVMESLDSRKPSMRSTGTAPIDLDKDLEEQDF